MKLQHPYFFILLIGSVVISSCKRHDPSPTDQVSHALVKSWKVSQVTKDGVDVTSTFNQLTVTFDDKLNYTSQNAVPPIWNASGIYSIKNQNDQNILVLDNSLEMYIQEASANRLQLKFNYQAVGGRVSSVSGEFTFVFIGA